MNEKKIVYGGHTGPTAESYSHVHPEIHGPPSNTYLPIPYNTDFHVAPTAHEHALYPSSFGTGPEGRKLQPRSSDILYKNTTNTTNNNTQINKNKNNNNSNSENKKSAKTLNKTQPTKISLNINN